MRLVVIALLLHVHLMGFSQESSTRNNYLGVHGSMNTSDEIHNGYFGVSSLLKWTWLELELDAVTVMNSYRCFRENEIRFSPIITFPKESLVRPFVRLNIDYGLEYYRWRTKTFEYLDGQIQEVSNDKNTYRAQSIYYGVGTGLQADFWDKKILVVAGYTLQRGNTIWKHAKHNVDSGNYTGGSQFFFNSRRSVLSLAVLYNFNSGM